MWTGVSTRQKPMTPEQIDDLLKRTLADHRLSRGERRVLDALLADSGADEQKLGYIRHRAFELARSEVVSAEAHAVMSWLEDVVKVLQPQPRQKLPDAEAFFSPGEDCLNSIVRELEKARRTIDICVFTITDNRISRAIRDAHDRRLTVRIITDNDKSLDRGSDIEQLERAGIAVRVDRTQHHMHHKFAIFDNRRLLTGSYNWTRSAAEFNEENMVVSMDPRLVSQFCKEFVRLWDSLG